MKTIVAAIGLLLLAVFGHAAAGVIAEELNPPKGQTQILLNAPTRQFRVVAEIEEDFMKMRSDEEALRWMARKAHELGADAIIPLSVGQRSGGGMVAPIGNNLFFVQGSRKVVRVQAIKYTD